MVLHFECFAGIAGDMVLGALVDLGVEPDELRRGLETLKLKGWELDFVREQRSGIGGMRAIVTDNTNAHNHEHHHEHSHAHNHSHEHRHWSEIRSLISNSEFPEKAKKIALAIFTRLAEAEAAVHETSVDDVAFHEVGAIDSIIDIAGTALGIAILSPLRITSSPVELGGGTVSCAHGILPVPAPATLRLCKGMPVRSGGFDKEMTTPTGAAILAACVDEFVETAEWRELKTGYGLGTRHFEKANVLRVSLREESNFAEAKEDDFIKEKLFIIESAIDDMNGEELGFLMEQLFDVGALDVTLSPCVMKKSRPGTLVKVLCTTGKLSKLRKMFFSSSTTLGIREYPVNRYSLKRENYEKNGVRIKKSYFENRERTKIEYDDKARIAKEQGISLFEADSFLRKP